MILPAIPVKSNTMHQYHNHHSCIIALHEKGYSEDFILNGNSLLWIQGDISFNRTDLHVVEQHSFLTSSKKERLIILGILIKSLQLGGILLYYHRYPGKNIIADHNRKALKQSYSTKSSSAHANLRSANKKGGKSYISSDPLSIDFPSLQR